jgi:hypothetical protein
MKTVSIDSIEEVKIVGFDLYLFRSDGSTEVHTNGLVDLAKGDLTILLDGAEVDIGSVVGTNDAILESLNNVFLENFLGNSSVDGTVISEEVLLEQLSEASSKLQEKENILAERLADISRIEKLLEEEKERTDKLEEDFLEQSEQSINETIEKAYQQTSLDNKDKEGKGDEENLTVKALTHINEEQSFFQRSVSLLTSSEKDSAKLVSLSLWLTSSSDSGFKSDFITNFNNSSSSKTLRFEGSSDAGATIVLNIDGNILTTAAEITGRWFIDFYNFLADGEYKVDVTAQGTDGGSSSLSNILTIDTIAPEMPNVSLASSADSGVLGDDITNILSLFNGIAEPETMVILTLNDVAYQTMTDDNGVWEITTQALNDGNYTYNVVAQDAAGNISSEITNNIIIDTVNTLTGGLDKGSNSADVSDEITNINNPGFSGTGEANSTVTLTLLLEPGLTEVYTTVIDENSLWRIDPIDTLAQDGVYEYTLESIDIAGNKKTLSQDFTLDTVAPVFSGGLSAVSDSGQSDSDGVTNKGAPTFEGSGEVNATVLLTFANGTTYTSVVDATGRWQVVLPTPLAAGDYNYTLSSTDIASNTRTLPVATLKIDTVAELTVTGLTSASNSYYLESSDGKGATDHITNIVSPSIEGKAEPGASITVTLTASNNRSEDFTSVADTLGNWVVAIAAQTEDQYTYTVETVDIAGNIQLITNQRLTIDITQPQITGGLAKISDTGRYEDDGITNQLTPEFEGTGAEGDVITLEINNQKYSDTVDTNGDWRILIPVDEALSAGPQSYVITGYDIAGNETILSGQMTTIPNIEEAVTVFLDVSDDTGRFGNDGITSITTPHFTGTGGAGDDIIFTITSNDQAFSQTLETTVDANSNWSIEVDSILGNGSYTYTATSTDIAGNTSTTADANNIIIDTVNTLTGGLDKGSNSADVSDEITNINNPGFSGTGEANSTVTLTLLLEPGLTEVYTTVIDENSLWRIDPIDTLAQDGVYEYTLESIDIAGNKKTLSQDFTLDTVAPVFSGGLSAVSDSGQSDSDGVTNKGAPTFEGSGEVNATVLLTFANGTTYTSVVDATGRWQVVLPTPLAAGDYNYTLSSTDIASNTRTLPVATLKIDTVAELTVTGLTSASNSYYLESSDGKGATDHITNIVSPSIEGKAEPGASITVTLTASNNRSEDFTSVADTLGNWVVAIAAQTEDQYTYTVETVDIAGNIQLITNQRLTIDITQPQITGGLAKISDTGRYEDDGITNQLTPEFEGTGAEGDVITLEINNQKYSDTVDTNGDWRILIPVDEALSAGPQSYVITGYDIAGNETILSGQMTTIPNIEEAVTVFLDVSDDTGRFGNDGITSITTPHFTGTGGAGDDIIFTITSNDQAFSQTLETTVDANSNWSIEVDSILGNGSYTYTATSTDIAGNTSITADANITIDIEPPLLTWGLNADSDTGVLGDNITTEKAVTFNGTSETDAKITLSIAQLSFTADADADGIWQITTTELPIGDHTYTITTEDIAGNITDIEDTLSIAIETSALTVGLDKVSDGGTLGDRITNNTNPFIGGQVTPTAELTITVFDSSNTTVGTYTTSANNLGVWQQQLSLPDDGSYSLSIISKHNDEQQSTSYSLVIDQTISRITGDSFSLFGATDIEDNLTSDIVPQILGQADSGDRVTINVEGVKSYKAFVDADGNYSVGLPGLTDGEYNYTVTTTDIAGNVAGYIEGGNTEQNNVATRTINIDREEPTITAALTTASDTGEVDRITQEHTPTIEGVITGEYQQVYLELNGIGFDAQSYEIKPNPDGSWSFTLPFLSDGFYHYQVTVSDSADNETFAQNNIRVIGFITPLTVDIPNFNESVGIQYGRSNELLVSGLSDVGAKITINLDGLEYKTIVDSQGNWAIDLSNINLSDEIYKLETVVEDEFGNRDEITSAIFIDSVAPSGTIDGLTTGSDTGSLSTDGVTNVPKPIFEGVGEIGASVVLTINGNSYTDIVDNNGDWTINVDDGLNDAIYTYGVILEDLAGNQTSLLGTIEVDTQAPISTGIGDFTSDDNLHVFSGNIDENDSGSLVEISLADTDYSIEVDDNGDWVLEAPVNLDTGIYNYDISITDIAGNFITETHELSIV